MKNLQFNNHSLIRHRTEWNAKRKQKPKGKWITIGDMTSATQIFQFYDADHSGMVEVEEICKGMKEEKQTQLSMLKRGDIKEMLSEYATFNRKTKKMEVSLCRWVNFTYGFKGDFDVIDPRSGKVVQSYKEERQIDDNNEKCDVENLKLPKIT